MSTGAPTGSSIERPVSKRSLRWRVVDIVVAAVLAVAVGVVFKLWDVAYEPFMSRDITRDDIRHLVRVGLEQTRGNYKALVQLFNMAPQDYKRFLNFLRKYGCHMPFQRFRMAPVRGEAGVMAPDAYSRPAAPAAAASKLAG